MHFNKTHISCLYRVENILELSHKQAGEGGASSSSTMFVFRGEDRSVTLETLRSSHSSIEILSLSSPATDSNVPWAPNKRIHNPQFCIYLPEQLQVRWDSNPRPILPKEAKQANECSTTSFVYRLPPGLKYMVKLFLWHFYHLKIIFLSPKLCCMNFKRLTAWNSVLESLFWYWCMLSN